MIIAGSPLYLRRIPMVEVYLSSNHNRESLSGPLAVFYEALCQGHDLVPVHVVRDTARGMYRLEDGRKRFAAHLLAGRPVILAVVEERQT